MIGEFGAVNTRRSNRSLEGGGSRESGNVCGVAVGSAGRVGAVPRHGAINSAASSGLSSPPSQLSRSRRSDRFLHPAVCVDLEDELGWDAGAQIADQRASPVQQGGDAARYLAADRDLAFWLARGGFAQ